MRRIALSLLALLGLTTACLAQATSAQQASTRLDAATGVAFAQATKGSASTATIVVPAGLYAYVTFIGIDYCTDGTGTATANLSTTAAGSNLPQLPQFAFSMSATADICKYYTEAYATPIKSSAPGVNVVLVGPAPGALNQMTMRIHYYLAP